MKPRSPITWFGGKGHMTAKLLSLMPEHDYYVEPFGGGASLLFAKPPAKVETYNDLDEGLVGLFRVLRDPEQFEHFRQKAELTLYGRAEYNECRKTWAEQTDPVERAYRWWIVARQSFGGCFGASWGTAITESLRGMAAPCSKFLSAIEALPAIHERLRRVQIECADWRVILRRYCGPGYLAYCDPPYPHGTRCAGEYAHEMTDADHAELVDALLYYDGKAMLSSYDSPIYSPLATAGWNKHEFKTACSVVGRTRGTKIQGNGAALRMQPRTEVVWVKPYAYNDLLTEQSP